jgi:natural product biosynthesis luciferase-like monooxygenase protein
MSDSFNNLKFSTLVDLLRYRSLHHPAQLAFTFLQDGETESSSLTYQELDRSARVIATQLQSLGASGSLALLLYPPGLEFIAGFFGCLYAGTVAIPAYPPRRNQNMSRLQAIVASSQAAVALTTTSLLTNIREQFAQNPELAALRWLATDNLASDQALGWQEPALSSDTLAFLQYTSGSTGTPKGVMVSHGNLLHNERMIERAFGHTEKTIAVGWLPLFHDMGLIGNVLQPLYLGRSCILMSPVDFLQKPFRWLQAISRYKATTSGGPNFAYDLCVRKITPEQRATLDLSSWEVAFTGAEPIRAETLERFAAAFDPCGFRKEAFYPCYGMAETTLFVSGGLKTDPPVVHHVKGTALEQNRVVTVASEQEDVRAIMGCGQTWLDQKIVVVDPESLTECLSDQVGEIWVSGLSVAQGYWRRPEETQQTFHAYLADTVEGPFLRTGDLGFLHNGELFVTGRLKDLVIIRGRNHYPQDIELTVDESHPALRSGCGAVFSVEGEGEERVVVVQEVERSYLRKLDVDEVVGAVREAVSQQHELEVYAVLLLKTGSIPKTSSGKIQRYACKERLLAGTLDIIASSNANLDQLLQDKCIHEQFEQQVQQTPKVTAVVYENTELSYQQLNQRANQLAHYLHKQGVEPGSRVGIYMARTPEIVVGLLGILKAGGAYVPLELSDLAQESASVLGDSQIPILVPQAGLLKFLSIQGSKEIYLDSKAYILAEESDENLSAQAVGKSLACVAYTAKSENQSSNLILTHKNVVDYFRRMDKRVGCQPTDTLLTGVNNFEMLSLLEVLWTLTRGAKVVFLSQPQITTVSPQTQSQAAAKGMQFSLFYFSSNEAEFANEKYKLVLEGAKFADKNGFTAVWIPERHFHPFGGLYPNPSVVSAALALVTEGIRLRAGSVVLPLHNPIRVAEEWSVVDNLSRGRVDLAFARGWNPNDFVLSPDTYANSKEALFSGMQTVQKLWRGEAISVPNGVGKDTEIKIYPLPMQQELKVWITCSGGQERFMEAGACGANILTALLFQSIEELAEKIAIYRESRAKHGHDPNRGQVTLMLHTFVGEDMEVVRNKVREPFIEYLKSSVDLWRHGSKSLDELTEIEQDNLFAYAFERYFQTSALFGTPSTCWKMVEGLKEIGVDEIACLIDFGVDVDSVLTNLKSLNMLRKLANGVGECSNDQTSQEVIHMQAMLEKHSVSLLHCTPNLVQQLTRHPSTASTLTSLQVLMVGKAS